VDNIEGKQRRTCSHIDMMTTATETQGFQHPGSPPTKASLTSWWDKFKGKSTKKDEQKGEYIYLIPLYTSYSKV